MLMGGTGNLILLGGVFTLPKGINVIDTLATSTQFNLTFTYDLKDEIDIFSWFQAQCLMGSW